MSGGTPEGAVKETIKKLLDKYDAWYCMPFGSLYGRSGIPDFVICHRGQFLAVEAKARKGRVSSLQKYEMAKIDKAWGKAMVVTPDNLGELEEWLDHGTGWKNRLFRGRKADGGADAGGACEGSADTQEARGRE